jgi:predicted amidohydrolase YtcJ
LGLHVLPGFVDAHIHFVSYGMSLLHVDLRDARSVADAVRRVADAARSLPPGSWVLGDGWDKNPWPEGRFPTRGDLDPVVPHHPVLLSSKDGHVAWTNSAGLRAASITRGTADPHGGVIARDASGEPDGILKEEATTLLRRAVPPASSEVLEHAALRAAAEAHRVGITGIHNFTGASEEGPRSFVVFRRLQEQGRLAVRVTACVPEGSLDAAVSAGVRTGLGDAMLRVGPLKIFVDGTLGSQTASMLEPFDGQPGNYGIQVRTSDEVDALVRRANGAGLWTAIHAIGDRANRDVLDVFERHHAASHRAGARHRLEHVQVVDPDDLPRLARLGVTASMQPIHATADRDTADRYWGARARWGYAWRSLAATGAALAFGSDAPVESPDPWRGVYAAVTRMRAEEPERPAWYPQECLTLEAAMRAYTHGAAYAVGAEEWQGTLEPGKVADFIVVDRDPFAIAARELLDVRVLATVVGGRLVHTAGPLAGWSA